MAGQVIDIAQTIDRLPMGRFQYLIFLMCGATLFVEGYDTQAIAYVAPAVANDWHLSRGALGPVFGAGLFGLMIGSFLIAPLADRIGRRNIILLSTVFFGAMTLATPLVHSVSELLILRLVTGIGLGGAMANAVTMAAEYAPAHRRASIAMIVFTGFPIGSAVGGLVAAWLLSAGGWHAVFVLGGAVTLVFAAVLLVKLPESARFLVLRDAADERLAHIMARIGGAALAEPGHRFVSGEAVVPRAAIGQLFRENRGIVTPLLWVVYFMSLLDLYLLASWLPTTIHAQGISVGMAVVVTSLLQVGGILGALTLGGLVQRFGAFRVMPVAYVLAAVSIACIAFVGGSIGLTMAAVFCAGFTVIGGQNCNNGLASIIYPTPIRATGVGFANAVGRIGSVTGPTIAGIMLSMDSDVRAIFLFGAIPPLCAAAALIGIGRQRSGAVPVQASWASQARREG
ncbi:MAG TPA: MFS transporter [Stellaceae bacterium]|jgi:AAHS family 4-hydroxybenzoate transporter-like MFS transporter|nr:MFS transporter [Stellaceae bacterium]